jgi:tetratricopeptide (TPR) repeat protein
MGTVWRAEQLGTHRQVALKLMSCGRLGSDRARQRFEREVELAARLEHPHIARVYENGSHDGTYFYAMQLVEGVHLDRYVLEQQLDRRQVLSLIRDVCLAVHYAHQRGVIHRDIKPSNILVDTGGHAHVVDFGLAKALEESPGDPTLTQEGQYAGTPAFMSPEQAAGKHDLIDTRTDVYGLGATLYLLLTGHTPHDQSGPRYEVMRRVAHDDVRPPRQMNKDVNGELGAVLLKALAHDPEQRYGSAAEVAQDIDRYLNGEALRAAPPSRAYRLRKFIGKHRAALGVAAGFAIMLVAATIVSTWQAVRATRATAAARAAEQQVVRERDQALAEKRRADEHAATWNAVGQFLISDMLGGADLTRQLRNAATADPDLKVRDMLDRSAERVVGRFQNPIVEANLRRDIGNAYWALGQGHKAESHLKAAIHLAQQAGQADHPGTFETMRQLGDLYAERGETDKGEPLLSDALAGLRRTAGEEHPGTIAALESLGCHYARRGSYDQAEALLTQVLEMRKRTLGEMEPLTWQAMCNLGAVYAEQERFDQAEGLYWRALQSSRSVLGEDDLSTLNAKSSLSVLYLNQGQLDRAEPICRDVFDARRRILGERHPDTQASLRTLAQLYKRQGRVPEAADLLSRIADPPRQADAPETNPLGHVPNSSALPTDQNRHR